MVTPVDPTVSKRAQWLLIWGFSSLQGAPAGDRVLIGAPSTSKELTWLQDSSCVYQEIWQR